MMRLILAELQKVWRNRVFCIALAALLCTNLFLLWVVTNPSSGAYSSHAYRTMNANLRGLSLEEKIAFVNEEVRRIQALAVIDNTLRTEAYDGGRTNEHYRQRYAAEFAEFYDTYAGKDYLRYNTTLANEYRFLEKIQAECKTVAEYDAFLDSIAQKAVQLSGISIFAESADGYDLANIEATAKAYESMRGSVRIDYSPQMGVFTALDFALTDLVTVFAMLLIATVLVRMERDNGLLALVRATPAGRGKTAAAKLAALMVSLAAVLVLLYGVNLAYCGAVYGLGDLTRSIQSVPALMRSTLPVRVWQYLGLFLFTKWLAALVAGTWVMLAMLLAKRAFAGTLGALALLAANLLVRSLVPATSRWNVLKYANLISLLRTNEVLGGYRNLYWFARPVSIALVEGVTAAVSLALFVWLFCFAFSKAQLHDSSRRLPVTQRFFCARGPVAARKKTAATTVFRQEAHKLLWMNGAAAFLLLFCFYQGYTAFNAYAYIDADEIYYRYYIKAVEGAPTQEKVDWLVEQAQEFKPVLELQAALAASRISSENYVALMAGYANLQQKMNAFLRVTSQLSYFKTHPRAQFVYESGWLKLMDLPAGGAGYGTISRTGGYSMQEKATGPGMQDRKDALWAALLCAMCFAGLFAMERQTGMETVIAATPLGRRVTAAAKLRCTTLLCTALTAAGMLPRLWLTLREYGLGALLAPSYSIAQLETMPLDIPLFFYLFAFAAARLVAVRCMAGVTLVLSYKTGNVFSALFLSGICFALPLLLSLAGLDSAKWLSVYPLFHAAGMLTQPWEAIGILGYTALCGGGIWLCNDCLKSQFGHA